MRRLELQQTNRPMDTFTYWVEGDMLDMDTPYQRGHVWGELRQRNLIKSIIQGIPIASIVLNDRSKNKAWGGIWKKHLAVIDGKQRMTAVLDFVDSRFAVPGEWFGLDGQNYLFCELPVARQRGFRHHPMAFSEVSLGSLEEEQEVFELVNFGGVPQGESDL